MGYPKQLLELQGEPLLVRVLREALRSELARVVVVLGYESQRIQRALAEVEDPKLEVAENRRFEEGMATSIIEGLKAVEARYDHTMVLLADMPKLTAESINALVRGYMHSRLSIAALYVGGKRAHPVIFGRKFYPELFRLKGDLGARRILERRPHEICPVEFKGDFDNRDLDTPRDYADWKARLKGNGFPNLTGFRR